MPTDDHPDGGEPTAGPPDSSAHSASDDPLGRVRAVARAIEEQVRNVLKDTHSDGAGQPDDTKEQPPLPEW